MNDPMNFMRMMECYGEYILWIGVDRNRQNDTGNKPISKHAKYINETNTKGKDAYFIPDVQSRSPLIFQSNLYLQISLKNNKIYKYDRCEVLESNVVMLHSNT